MSLLIEDYALIGDCHTAALVGRDGSIDWFCLPRFDSGACFAALLGTKDHGRWLLAPTSKIRHVRRRYRDDTLVLETEFETDDGSVVLIDCMPLRTKRPDIVRLIAGKDGEVRMRMELILRFDYGQTVPWVRRRDGGIHAVAGPNAVRIETPVPLRGQDLTTVAEFSVRAGQRLPFVLTWHRPHRPAPVSIDAEEAIEHTEQWWRAWSGRCTYKGEWRAAVVRSLITLKALTYAPTGGIVAAPTTSLPEHLGGVRNWDYRFCWLRDATFALYILSNAGYHEEACAWREWLLRAVAGSPSQLQTLYGLAGERRLTEIELDRLPGYEHSTPVRIGNAAYRQFQLDVFGEFMDSLQLARRIGLHADAEAWHVQRKVLDYLESKWNEPDNGIWEVRGAPRHFTHSKVMAWVAIDRAIKTVERFAVEGPVEHWRQLRTAMHTEICRHGFDAEMGSFVQSYGSKELDASLLMLPMVGFLSATDPRMRGTVEAIERHLANDGFVTRYSDTAHVDELPEGEQAFLLCTFWLADNLALLGRHSDARRLFERLLAVRNDVGLLSEQYDPAARRLMGNFPQAYSHVALVNTAQNLMRTAAPAGGHGRG